MKNDKIANLAEIIKNGIDQDLLHINQLEIYSKHETSRKNLYLDNDEDMLA